MTTETMLPYQDRVRAWLEACFGPEVADDTQQRNHRFLEEALEFVQACGCTPSEAHQLVDYVFGRPVGEKGQEAGAAMLTLAGACHPHGINLTEAAEVELARCWQKTDAIREKWKGKPKHSPLPAHDLWCVHILGPDDLYPAPDLMTAVAWAQVMNRIADRTEQRLANLVGRPLTDDEKVLCYSNVERWPWSAEAHALALPGAIQQMTPRTPPSPPAGALAPAEKDQEEPTICVCGEPIRDGDKVYTCQSSGIVHAECMGTDPENFPGPDGEPRKPGDPIPAPWIYSTGEARS